MGNKDIIKLAEFDKIVNNNKISGRDWYYGLKGRWWWGMSESHARRHVAKLQEKAIKPQEKSRKEAIKLQEKSRKETIKLQEKSRKLQEEAIKLQEKARKLQEKARKEEEARKREEYIKKREEEIRKIEEARKREEYIKKREEEIRKIEEAVILETEKISANKIVLASTWNVRCGIATYTKYLLDSLDRIIPNSFMVDSVTNGELKYKSLGKLTHLQHEFGIVPNPPEKIKGKLIITWHSVSEYTNDEIKKYESKHDVVAHIVHSEHMRHSIDSSRDIWVVPHGSTLMHQMKREDAKRILSINTSAPIGFVFGFQSGDKNYQRLIDAAKNTGIHLIISGAQHMSGYSLDILNDENVTFINRFMEENEVNLYALASDLLLFDYVGKENYSVSGAMHRIIGSGRPIVCSNVRHFGDLEHRIDCLKFKNQEELEKCIIYALENGEKFGLAAREYSERTSWESVARKHIEVYSHYVDI